MTTSTPLDQELNRIAEWSGFESTDQMLKAIAVAHLDNLGLLDFADEIDAPSTERRAQKRLMRQTQASFSEWTKSAQVADLLPPETGRQPRGRAAWLAIEDSLHRVNP